jgi:hypothetical protein
MSKSNTFEIFTDIKMALLNQNTRIVISSNKEENRSIFVVATTTTTLWGC